MPDLHIRNETRELRLLFEISQVLEGASALADHLDTALELIARHTGMMRGTLLVVDPASRDIVVESAYGLNSAELRRARYKYGEGVTGRVIETGESILVPKVSEEPLFLNRTGARDLSKGEISFICVPILLEGKTVGAISADRLFADSVCLEEDMRLLRVIASLVSRAVRTRREIRVTRLSMEEENRRLRRLLRGDFNSGRLLGSSPAIRAVLEEIAQVSGAGTTILIRGESGTGKDLAAGVIHTNSARHSGPFVKVNCAALPESLVESELFGHERGAFTGAVSTRKGRFEMAQGGTLFLDEVGEMTPMTQAKLLRVVQEKEFERVGGSETLRVDVRLITATNRNLETMVERGEFRQDLYYRLSVFPILMPPLRERREDIMPLVEHFVDKAGSSNEKKILRISTQAADLLAAYHWPGNIRELENVVERAVILCGADGVIDIRHLPPWIQGKSQSTELLEGNLDQALAELERSMIVHALRRMAGNMREAARELGITPRIMGLRMQRHNLDYRAFRRLPEEEAGTNLPS